MDVTPSCSKEDIKVKKRKPGVIYLSLIPKSMNVLKIREYFSYFGDLGNVYLHQDKSNLSK